MHSAGEAGAGRKRPAPASLRSRRRIRALFAAAVMALSTVSSTLVTGMAAHADGTNSGQLREVGTVDTILGYNPQYSPTESDATNVGFGNGDNIPPMFVDPTRRLGFVIGTWAGPGLAAYTPPEPDRFAGNETHLLVFDLDTQQLLSHVPLDHIDSNLYPSATPNCIADSATAHLICVVENTGITAGDCATTQLGSVVTVDVFDYSDLSHVTGHAANIGCAGSQVVGPRGLSLDLQDGLLYVAGLYQMEGWRAAPFWAGSGWRDSGAAPVLEQIELNKLYHGDADMVDWAVDLRYAGCSAFPQNYAGQARADKVPFVQRVGNYVLTFCDDERSTLGVEDGALDYVVRIPLDHGAPIADCRGVAPAGSCAAIPDLGVADPSGSSAVAIVNYAHALMPTLSGPATAAVDPQTKYVLLTTADTANGDAVWVFDPNPGAGRFVGQITGGGQSTPTDQSTRAEKTATGIDPVNGRAYLLTSDGVLVAQTRLNPLPAGQIYSVVNRDTDKVSQTAGGWIRVVPATDTQPTLLLIPVQGVGYRVVEDDVPDAPAAAPDTCTDSAGNAWSGPDCRTDPSLTEEDGKTQSTTTGTAHASGARILVTGGLQRLEDNNDPLCQTDAEWHSPVDFTGLGSAPPAFCAADMALANGDSDFSLGATNLSTGSDFGANADAAGLAFAPNDAADRKNISDPANEQDQTGQEVPATNPYTQVSCSDFGGSPGGASSPSSGGLEAVTAASEVGCDASTASAGSVSAVSAIAVPSPSNPIISVAQVSSSISSGDTTKGQETKTDAVASGITIDGVVSIGQVVASADTFARGHAGSATTTYSRWWCAITIAGAPAEPNCMNPDDPSNAAVIDQINQALGNTWVTAPLSEQQATPGGYQAKADKDPGEAQADSAVNDDTSPQVPGMQIIHYNDGPSGLSRVIVQLANTDAESEYAVVPLPDFGAFDDSTLPDLSTIAPSVAPTPSLSPVAAPEPQQSQVGQPAPQATTPTPQVRTRYVPPTRVLRSIRPVAALAPMPLGDTGTSPPVAPETAPPASSGILAAPQQVVSRALHLLVENPAQFALLAGIWTLLLAPVFVAYRRRSWARALES